MSLVIEAMTPSDAVLKVWDETLRHGVACSPRGLPIREVMNVLIDIEDPRGIPFNISGRDLKPGIAAIEALQLVAGTTLPSFASRVSPPLGRFRNEGMFDGAYGPRITGGVRRVLDELKRDPDSRRAVLTIYDWGRDLGVKTLDVPCTLSVQWMLRDDKLHMTTTMRSNDVWLGLPYDLHQFIALHCAVAESLNVEVGHYVHSVASLHAYANDAQKIESALELRHRAWAFSSSSRLWSGTSWAEIVEMAEGLLLGVEEGKTQFERWAAKSLERRT